MSWLKHTETRMNETAVPLVWTSKIPIKLQPHVETLTLLKRNLRLIQLWFWTCLFDILWWLPDGFCCNDKIRRVNVTSSFFIVVVSITCRAHCDVVKLHNLWQFVVMSPQCRCHDGSHVTTVYAPQWLSSHHTVVIMMVVMSPQCRYHNGSQVTTA